MVTILDFYVGLCSNLLLYYLSEQCGLHYFAHLSGTGRRYLYSVHFGEYPCQVAGLGKVAFGRVDKC